MEIDRSCAEGVITVDVIVNLVEDVVGQNVESPEQIYV